MLVARSNNLKQPQHGFTLIELVIVFALMGAIILVVGSRSGTFGFWKDEAFLRRLTETITFLHHQAVVDQAFYRLEFDINARAYSVGVLRPEGALDTQLSDVAAELGNLSLELAAFLSPALGSTMTLIPPPSFPSLAEPQSFPEGTVLEDILTMRGETLAEDGGKPFILFSPRGFSEFAVIHLRLSNDTPITILINPFTGVAEVYREYREFEWTWGQNRRER